MVTRPDFVELRVHGVSGTPPEKLLGATEVEDLAGDDLVRFVRHADPQQRGVPVGWRRGELEGMSWGRLTSGPATQVAWLALLPFALVNLAFWTNPPSHGTHRIPDGVFRALVRLLALSLTVLLALAAAHVAMDLVAWQCAGQTCAVVSEPLAFAEGWPVGRRVALAAVVPAVLLGGLAWLSHRVSLRFEAVEVRPTDAASGNEPLETSPEPTLTSPLMWRGESLVARLRSVHLGTGIAAIGVLLAWGALAAEDRDLATTGWAVAGGAFSVLLVAVGAGALAWPSRIVAWTDRWLPRQRRYSRLYVGAAVVGTGAAAYGFALAYTDGAPGGTTALPGLPSLLFVLGCLQVVLVGGLLVATHPPQPDTAEAPAPDGVRHRSQRRLPPLRGRAGVVVALAAVFLGYVYSAGIALRGAGLLSGDDGPVFVVPELFRWAAAGFTVVVVVVVLLGIYGFLRISSVPAQDVENVLRDYREDGLGPVADARDDHRVRRIVRARRMQRTVQVRTAFLLLAFLAAVGGVSSVVALVGQATGWGERPLADRLSWLVTTGSWLVAGLVGLLVMVAVAAYRSEDTRRRLGILWDVLSFWPRGGHPLAPPSYPERAVPQLLCRVQHLRTTGGSPQHGTPRPVLLLSAHSQGSLLALAVLGQLRRHEEPDRPPAAGEDSWDLALLSHGSPLGRLYEPLFPRHFGRKQLAEFDEWLGRRWRNLYRPTDPIGSSLRDVLGDRDVRVEDPRTARMDGELSAYAPIRGHSDYPGSALYDEARHELLVGRVRTTGARPGTTATPPRPRAASDPSVVSTPAY